MYWSWYDNRYWNQNELLQQNFDWLVEFYLNTKCFFSPRVCNRCCQLCFRFYLFQSSFEDIFLFALISFFLFPLKWSLKWPRLDIWISVAYFLCECSNINITCQPFFKLINVLSWFIILSSTRQYLLYFNWQFLD